MINPLRFTGLSGLDTESMIEQLMEAERVKVTKVEKEKQLILWRQELYNDLNKDFANFIINTRREFGLTTTTATGALLPNSYKNLSWYKKASSSDTTVATVSASSTVFDGSYKVNVRQLAEGVTLASAEEIKNLGQDGIILNRNGDKITNLQFTIYDGQVDEMGEPVAFEINISNENGITMEEVARAINSAKATVVNKEGKEVEYSINIRASYDSVNKRFFLQTKETGEKAQIKIEVDRDNDDYRYFIRYF